MHTATNPLTSWLRSCGWVEVNLTVTAERVETAEQLSFLNSHDCDKIQGYYASRPVEPKAFENLLVSDFNLYNQVVSAKAG